MTLVSSYFKLSHSAKCLNSHLALGGMVVTNADGVRTVYNLGDMSWVIAATALVFIMIPGVGFFYSGLLRRKEERSLHVVDINVVRCGCLPSSMGFRHATGSPHSTFSSGFSRVTL